MDIVMKTVAGVFIFFVMFIQINNAQQYYPDNFLDSFFFYNQPSTSAEGTGKIYLNNNNDAFSSFYNPALSSASDNLRFSYSTSQRSHGGIVFNNYGVDVPVKNIGTFSFTKRDFVFNVLEVETAPFININSISSYDLNYSREIYGGLSGGIGLNYLRKNVSYFQNFHQDFYSFDIGVSYVYNLSTLDKHSDYVFANASVMNIRISKSKNIVYTDYRLPQIDHVSLGYVSKYGIKNNRDVFQTDVQIEYSGLLNSIYYNTLSLGAEIKFMEIFSIRTGYYKIEGEYFTDEDITFGFGFSYPFKIYLENSLVIGFDCAKSKYSYYNLRTDDIFNSFALYLKYDMR
jgi:hypothetical protein